MICGIGRAPSVAAAHTDGGCDRNHANVSGFAAAPGSGSRTASNSLTTVPSTRAATEAKDRIELAPGCGPSVSMSVTT
jgi:hypothetical protein